MSATAKELLKSDSICKSYAELKKGPVFWTQHVETWANKLMMMMMNLAVQDTDP